MSKRVGQFVAELFVVVGWDEETENGGLDVEIENEQYESIPPSMEENNPTIFSASLTASLLNQYPTKDRLPQIPNGIEYFCFPMGLSVNDVPLPPRFHSFIHTSEDGSRLIGCALTFSEEITNKQREVLQLANFDLNNYPRLYVRKALCLLTHWPFLSAFKTFLTRLYQLSLRVSNIPIERFICNFLDDVPAPTSGKVDIHYFFHDEVIAFQCPPLNAPNAWSGFPLFPLFECLSAMNILELFGLLLIERQILFVSSQYSLLTVACEAMTSLLYPLRWAHAYIPILPRKLLGAVGAPFPYLFGIHVDMYATAQSLLLPETVCVFLDENRIEFGLLGKSPKFPERRYRKLLQAMIQSVSWCNKSGELMYPMNMWKLERLELFDDALTDVTNLPMKMFWKPSNNNNNNQTHTNHYPTHAAEHTISSRVTNSLQVSNNLLTIAATSSNNNYNYNSTSNSTNNGHCKIDNQGIREGFLNFFVAMLKDYRRFLVYPSILHLQSTVASPTNSGEQQQHDNSMNSRESNHLVATINHHNLINSRFKFEEFLHEQPNEWKALLEQIVVTQAFSDFIDDRIALNKLDRDVIFFDESIEAKWNRYTFRSKNFDTPFLTYEQDRHTKSYVPPTPMAFDLPTDLIVQYNTFPRLQ
jgi:hypothetical protein